MNEFEIIEKFFRASSAGPGLAIGVGDDCAVIDIPHGQQIVLTTDTLVEGVHFPRQSPPAKLGYRTCATALSDIAAMGGSANWASLALSLPSFDDSWVSEFVSGFGKALAIDKSSLVGGDLTRGPLAITWHITGTVPRHQALLRSGCCVDDDIYVSGTLGGAAYALDFLSLSNAPDAVLEPYWAPLPRMALGRAILPLASSCIDISDGFVGDLGHLLRRSEVAAIIDIQAIPVNENLRVLSDEARLALALNGGDDYELCFTAKKTCRRALDAMGHTLGINLTRVGKIVAPMDAAYVARDSTGAALQSTSFQHFAD
ncbi:MAG: thiamine-phosphate kinase [Gammaproteobacteria bacterium]